MALPKVEFDFEHHTEEITEFGWPWHGRWDGSFDGSHTKLLKTNVGPTIPWPAMPEPTPEIITGVIRFFGSVKANLSPIAKDVLPNSAETAEGMQLSKYAIYSGKDAILYNHNMANKWVFIDEKNKPWLAEILPGSSGILRLVEFGVFTDSAYIPKTFDISITGGYHPQWVKVDDITKRGDRALLTNWTLTATELGKYGIIEALTRKQYMGVYEISITGYYNFDTQSNTLACSFSALKEGAQLTPVVNNSTTPKADETETYVVKQYRIKRWGAVSGDHTANGWTNIQYDWIYGGGAGIFLYGPNNEFPQEFTYQDAINGGVYGAYAASAPFKVWESTHYMTNNLSPNTSYSYKETIYPSSYTCYMDDGPANYSDITVTLKHYSPGWEKKNIYIGCFYDQDDIVQHVTFEIKQEQYSEILPDYNLLYVFDPHVYSSNATNSGIGSYSTGYYSTSVKKAYEGSTIEATANLLINGSIVDSCFATSKSGYFYTNTVNKSTNSSTTTSENKTESTIDGVTNNNLYAFPIQYSNTLYGLAFPGPGAGNYTWRGIHGKWGDLASKETVVGFKVQASENPITGEVVRSELPVCFV